MALKFVFKYHQDWEDNNLLIHLHHHIQLVIVGRFGFLI